MGRSRGDSGSGAYVSSSDTYDPPSPSPSKHGKKTPKATIPVDMTDTITMPSMADQELNGGRLHNPEAVGAIRKHWITSRMRERAGEFASHRRSTIWCGTYNVNGKKDQGEDLSAWLTNLMPPDIYAIGLQEIVDLNAVNVAVTDSKSKERAAMWRSQIERCLSTSCSYRLVAQRHLVGVLMFVFVREDHCRAGVIKDVQDTSVSTGIMGVMGNKGAVCVRLQAWDTTLCFVCSHLAAHRGNVEGRNADYWAIMSKASFDGEPETAWELRGLRGTDYSSGRTEGCLGILDSDTVFWMGDLNYRVAEEIPTEEVLQRVQTSEGLVYLRAHDQLNVVRRGGTSAAFGAFEEGALSFMPTYKYQPGKHIHRTCTNAYEQRPEKKLRAPAWCDRVLWRSQERGHVSLSSYRSADLMLSDHMPVCASLDVKLRELRADKQAHVYEEVMHCINSWEGRTQVSKMRHYNITSSLAMLFASNANDASCLYRSEALPLSAFHHWR
ncbi:unnamed protein product [Chrysoparadoxa australica]